MPYFIRLFKTQKAIFEDNYGHLFFEMFFNDALQLQYFDFKTEHIKTITLLLDGFLDKIGIKVVLNKKIGE